MDTAITKTRFQHHFEYDWIKYILIVVASVILWVTLYSVASPVMHWEELDITCYYTPVISREMGDKTKDFRTTVFGEDTVIKSINYQEFNDAQHGYLFDTYVPTADITLISKDEVEKTLFVMDGYFFRFDEITDAYPDDIEWRQTLETLDACGALYRYHLPESVLDEYKTEEGKQAIRDLAAPYENQVVGIWLNKIPRADEGCFFEFEEITKDASGNDITPYRENYLLTLNKINLSKTSGGGNKGVFNAEGQDTARTETFDFVKFLFRDDPDRSGFQYIDRFIVTA